MLRLLKKLLALPLGAIWMVLTLLPGVQPPVWLLKSIWQLDGHPVYAVRCVTTVERLEGYEAAEGLGKRLYEEDPSSPLAACLGLQASEHGDIDVATEWFVAAQECDRVDQDLLLHLEMSLAECSSEYDGEEIAARIVARRDVSMWLTHRALKYQVYRALLRQEWQRASEILDRVFQIENPANLRWMRWVAAAGMGLKEQAEHWYQHAWKDLEPIEAAMHRASGWYMIGDSDRGRASLVEAIEAGATAEVVKQFCTYYSIELDDHALPGAEEEG